MAKNNYTVLYAEDEAGVRENIAQSLRYKCENVIEAVDGEDAYNLYKEKHPDIIITDIQMPKMNGLELIEKIRKTDSEIPIVVLSAHTEKDKLLQAIKFNLTDYIVKPITRSSLRVAVDNAFSKLDKKHFIDMKVYNDLLESIIIFDEDNNILECNNAALELFEYDEKEDMIGLSAYDIALDTQEDKINESRKNHISIHNEIYLQKSDKTIFMAKTQSKATTINTKKVRVVSIVNLSDVIKMHMLDSLTTLLTRKTLELDFKNIMKKHSIDKEGVSALFIDIDNFKSVNDTYGHQVGDELIKKVASTLLKGVRASDLVVRWGGDEFMIILLNTNMAQTRTIAQNLRENISKIEIESKRMITCSFGIDAIKEDDTLEDVTGRIDSALLSAKRGSKNCVIEYSK